MSAAAKPISLTYELATFILHLDEVAPQLVVRSVEGGTKEPVAQIARDELAAIAYDITEASALLKKYHRLLAEGAAVL